MSEEQKVYEVMLQKGKTYTVDGERFEEGVPRRVSPELYDYLKDVPSFVAYPPTTDSPIPPPGANGGGAGGSSTGLDATQLGYIDPKDANAANAFLALSADAQKAELKRLNIEGDMSNGEKRVALYTEWLEQQQQ